MNYLGIDFGLSKIGLAKGSDALNIATPFDILSHSSNLIDDLSKIVKENEIDEIVVGFPLSLSGAENKQTKIVDDFIGKLKILGKPIHKQDERFSTRSAVSEGKDDDSSAAALILQTFLDKIHNI